ncbi:hypothetical protein D926_02024 [Enterococcus faecalis D811610-10]|nr:hypothetical protein D926_02024 [Enterococcus faecalis D811610-10]
MGNKQVSGSTKCIRKEYLIHLNQTIQSRLLQKKCFWMEQIIS